ncbi:MAG: hypothetical protein AAGJ53_06135 [Pseudomonadota bacterium]
MHRTVLLAMGLAIALTAGLAHRARAAELVMFDAANCVWCIRWDRDIGRTYGETAEGRIAPLRKVRLADGIPPDIAIARPVTGTPTFVLVAQGREIGRIIGYPGQSAFWADLNALIDRLPNQKPRAVPETPLTQTTF